MLARHFSNRQQYIMLALVLLAVLTFSGAVAAPVWALTTPPAQDSATPIQVQLKMDKLPTLGQTATLSCVATTVRPAPNTTVQLVLPEGAQIVGGKGRWSGNLQLGAPVTLTATVRFGQLGNTEVACRARRVIDAQNSWGDYRALYFTLGPTSSQVGFEKQPYGQGVYMGGADTPPSPEELNAPVSLPKELPAPQGPAIDPDADPTSLAPAAPAAMTVTGYWKYYNRAGALIGANRFFVYLVDGADYTPLGSCYTGATGYYSCSTSSVPASGTIRTAILTYVKYAPYDDVLQVTSNGSSNYGYVTAAKAWTTGLHNIGIYYIAKTEINKRAFWAKDDLNRAWNFIWAKTGKTQVPQETGGPGHILWYPGSTDGTYFSFDDGMIHLDESDPKSHDTAIHEYGHNVMYNKYGYFPYNYCPSPHYVNVYHNPQCAWTEGWANFLPLAVNNSPVYHWDDGFGMNFDTPTWGTANWDSGDGVEGRVAGAFWDIYDATVDGTDNYAGGLVNIWDTFFHQQDTTFREYYLAWIGRAHGTAPQGAIFRNTIDYRVPGPLTLSSPANGAILHTNTPTLSWKQAARATAYEYRIRKGTTTSPVVQQAMVYTSPFTAAYLEYGLYYWQFRGCNEFGCGAYTALRSFKLAP